MCDLSRPQIVKTGVVPTFTAANVSRLAVCLVEQGAIGRFSIESAEMLQGFPAGWTDLSDSPLVDVTLTQVLSVSLLGSSVLLTFAESLFFSCFVFPESKDARQCSQR